MLAPPEVSLVSQCTLQALCKSFSQNRSLSRIHGSVGCAIFPCMETMPMQWMDGADTGYTFVPIASCPESGESAFEPIALA